MLYLKKSEAELFTELGWRIWKDSDGMHIEIDLGERQISMFPTLKRQLKPMVFRPQGDLFISDYTELAEYVKQYKRKGFGYGVAPYNGSLDTDAYDQAFARRVHDEMIRWATEYDLKAHFERVLNPSRQTRTSGDLIDLAYCRQTDVLESLPIGEQEDGSIYIDPRERDPEGCLRRAIEISKRP